MSSGGGSAFTAIRTLGFRPDPDEEEVGNDGEHRVDRPAEPLPRRGPHTGKGPRRDYQGSDERIREDVCELLDRDGAVDASNLEVEVQHGEVTLSGTVPERGMKRMAEDCATDCAGVRDVQNRIRVDAAGYRDQTEIPKRRWRRSSTHRPTRPE